MTTYYLASDGDVDGEPITPSAASRKANASELDKRVAALADRARAAHVDPTVTVTRERPWSRKDRP